MAIEITNPIEIPAVEAKVADKVWIIKMEISAASASEPVRAYFNVAPFISSTGEIVTTQKRDIFLDDVFTACEANQKLGMAMGTIYEAVQELCKQQRLFGMEPDATP